MVFLSNGLVRLRFGRLSYWADQLFPNVIADAQVPDDHGLARWRPDEPDAYCQRCGLECGPGAALASGCAQCVGHRMVWDRIVRLSTYHQHIDRWILDMKFSRHWTWAPWLGKQLADAISPLPDNKRIGLCSVPMHLLRRWNRGFNQSELIARAMAKRLDIPLIPVLRRSRYTVPQTTVAADRRHTNVHQSFELIPMDLTDWEIWLIDDVKTTGATLTACAKLLRQAGAARVHVAVVAVAEPRPG